MLKGGAEDSRSVGRDVRESFDREDIGEGSSRVEPGAAPGYPNESREAR